MRTNSIISDPELLVPQVRPIDKTPEPQNDFEKLANSADYPQFQDYIDQRIKYFTQYLPSSGKPIESLSDQERVVAWGQATVVIKELELLNNHVQNLKRKR